MTYAPRACGFGATTGSTRSTGSASANLGDLSTAIVDANAEIPEQKVRRKAAVAELAIAPRKGVEHRARRKTLKGGRGRRPPVRLHDLRRGAATLMLAAAAGSRHRPGEPAMDRFTGP